MWPFKRKSTPKQPRRPVKSDVLFPLDRVPVPFPDDISELSVLKHHATRALCGVLMSTHSECRSPHPFCGPTGPNPTQLIAQPINQVSPNGPVLAIYIGKAVNHPDFPMDRPVEPFDGAVSLEYAESTPHRKLVVNLNTDGTYTALYGPILNPIEGNYATGSIDGSSARLLYSNPEPQHAKWQYRESEIPEGDTVPEYHCLRVHGWWWVVEVDRSQGLVQQVAGLEVTDDPEHNYGIHSRPHAMYATDPRDNSEWAKVIRENCPVIM